MIRKLGWKVMGALGLALLVTNFASCQATQQGALITARSRLNEGNYGDALKDLATAERMGDFRARNTAEIYFLRGMVYMQTGNVGMAKANFQQATKYQDTIYAEYAKVALKDIEKIEKKR